MPFNPKLVESAEVRQLAKDMKGTDLLKEMKKELTEAVRPMIPMVQSAVRATPSKHSAKDKRRSLRDEIARSVVKLTRVGAARTVQLGIQISSSRMGKDKSLAWYMEGIKPWRHPRRAHPEMPWIQQSAHPYFYETLNRMVDVFDRKIDKIIEDFEKKVG